MLSGGGSSREHSADAAGGGAKRSYGEKEKDGDEFRRNASSDVRAEYDKIRGKHAKMAFRKDWREQRLTNVSGTKTFTKSNKKGEVTTGFYKNWAQLVECQGGLVDPVFGRRA